MKYIEALNTYDGKDKSLFLAGGITNCPDWQSDLVNLLKKEKIILFNPRRKDFPMNNPNAAQEQIKWEYENLRKSSVISFWFSKETLCPIVLYELGAWSMMKKPIFIGVDPEYSRKKDVEIQTKLARPEIKIVYDIESLSKQIKEWIKYK